MFANVQALFCALKAALKQPMSIFTTSVLHLILGLDAQGVRCIHLSKAPLRGLSTFVYRFLFKRSAPLPTISLNESVPVQKRYEIHILAQHTPCLT